MQPDLPAPEAPAVTRLPTPGEQQIAADQGRLEKVRWHQDNPWGTPENHPGALGKAAHIFSQIGNIAGDIFAPNVMERIPGTELGMRAEETGLAKRLNSEISDESLNKERGATAAKTEAETPEIAPDAEARRGVEGATTEHLKAETAGLENPQEDWKAMTGFTGPNGEPVLVSNRGKVKLGDIGGLNPTKQEKPNTPEQQYLDEYAKLHPGSTIAAAERAYTLDTQRPPQIAPIMMMVPNPNGGSTATVVHPGQTVQPGTVTASGFNSESVSANKGQMADTKALRDLAGTVQTMRQYAATPSPANDFGIVMSFAGAVKPEAVGKLRWQKGEQDFILGLRNSMGDLQALGQRIQNGQPLTPPQRQDMIHAVEIVTQAKAREAGKQYYQGHFYGKGDDGQWHQESSQ